MKEKISILKLLFAIIALYSISMLSPLVVDDYYFKSLRLNSFSECVQYILHYGNGRLLGNLLVLYALKNPIILSVMKTLMFLSIGFFMSKIINNIVGGKNESIVFLLLITMPPQIFAQVYSWTSGFCNYVPPVLCNLYLIHSFLISDRKQGCLDIFVVFFVGLGSELFVEHSAIINFTLMCCIAGYCFIKKRNTVQAVLCWVGTFMGLIIIFLVPRIFATTTGFENYQKLNLGNLHDLLMSIVSNALLICEKYSSAVVLWLVMSSVMLKRCRKQKHTYIVSIIFIVYPIYSGIIYIITHYFSIKMGTAISILNAIVMFIYLMSIYYVIIKMEKSKIRNLSCILFYLAIYSVLPLLIVYPIGERCLFHSYIILELFVTLNCLDVFDSFRYKGLDVPAMISVVFTIMLVITYLRIYRIDKEKINYIEVCIEKQEKEILIPKISSDYIHSSENIMISNAYFYKKPGDITFKEIKYSDWVEIKKY